jgi:hypothetical protein
VTKKLKRKVKSLLQRKVKVEKEKVRQGMKKKRKK